ncbi:MAG: metal-dependent hydrolase [Verrucomicrobiae bacterium]|nr:metal-dependent hydrolase [Verrucomicrobiae bacterium]
MDTIAHGLAGAVIGYCGFRQRAGRAALAASVLGAEFPDIDIVLLLVNSETYLNWHRGITHSVLLLPVWSWIVAFLVWDMMGRKNFRILWGASAAGMLSHLVMDWITSYGTMLLSPVSDARFSLNLVFILDPYVWAMLGVGLWAVIRSQKPRPGLICIGVLCAYLLLCSAAKLHARHEARREGGSGELTAYAQPLRPFSWTVVRDEGKAVYWSADGKTEMFEQFYDDDLLPKAEATEAVKTFRWFAANPVVEKLTENGRTVLRYRDLRFRSPLPWGTVREGLFVVAKVAFDSHGNVIASGLASEDR